MALCPITIVSSCKSCPVFKVCPGKSIIGDHKKLPEKKEVENQENQKNCIHCSESNYQCKVYGQNPVLKQ